MWPSGGQDGRRPDRPKQRGHGQQPYQFTGSYSGLGMFEETEVNRPVTPVARGNRKRPVAFAVAGLTAGIIVGSVATGVLLTGHRPTPVAAPAPPKSSEPMWTPPPAPTPRVPGWRVGYNPLAQLAYDLPPDWNVRSDSDVWTLPRLGDMTFRGLAEGPGYSCAGRPYVRGQAVSTMVKPTKPLDQTATEFAQFVGQAFYTGSNPAVRPGPPQPVTVDGVGGVKVDAALTMPPAAPCLPTEARVASIAFQGKDSFVVLVVAEDSAGGVPQPPALGNGQVQQVIGSARPVRG